MGTLLTHSVVSSCLCGRTTYNVLIRSIQHSCVMSSGPLDNALACLAFLRPHRRVVVTRDRKRKCISVKLSRDIKRSYATFAATTMTATMTTTTVQLQSVCVMSSAVTLASTSRDEITSLAFHCVSSNSRITLPSSLVCLPARYHTVTVCSPIYGRFPIFEGWMVLSTSGGIFKPSDFRDNFYASASNSRQTALC